MEIYQLFATTPKAMEAFVAEELLHLGAENIRQTVAGVSFNGTLETAYRACLWSRCASRILLILDHFEIQSQDDLYQGILKTNWFDHINPDSSFAISFNAKNSEIINNSHFGALKVKDAIVDQMRDKFNKRPNIDLEYPDIRLNIYLNRENVQLSLDLSGESLHKRGYRRSSVPAPIKENLAAAMLYRSNWPTIAQQSGSLLDPMCGSGTILLEGAMMAADYAPGLLRNYFGFSGWKQHNETLWQKLLAEAETRRSEGIRKMPLIIGFDQNKRTVSAAHSHIQRVGLQDKIHIERRDISDARPAESWPPGLVICNPPYGERLGNEEQAAELYYQFGEVLKTSFTGWKATMILGNPELGFRLGIRSQKPVTLYNGALECKLLRMDITPAAFFIPKARTEQERIDRISEQSRTMAVSDGAQMFGNRLKKNLKKLKKWANRNQITCYRIYDSDLPEYALAIDLYQGEQTWVNVQEYEAPKTIDRRKADQRLTEALSEIPRILGIPSRYIVLKVRRKQKNTDQYEKHNEQGRFHIIQENGCKLQVNFEDYLDTGVFLDHRPLRRLIMQQARGKKFLNLFAYTGSASVHAALGGAISTTSVDMSNTYLEWAKQNFEINGIQGNHEFIQADCLNWLEDESRHPNQHYDIIFLDPPTFSNSKRMENNFDIQNDHIRLIQKTSKLLTEHGILYFSTNYRRFKIDKDALAPLKLKNISADTIPEDFSRNPRIHYCWEISL